MSTIIISLALLMVAGIAKAVQDTIQFHYTESVFADGPTWFHRWADPVWSWLNKYKENNPALGDRFPFSTTLLVWTTDLWHFAQMIELTAVQVAIALHVHVAHFLWADGPAWTLVVLDVCLFKAVQSGSFELFFSRILLLAHCSIPSDPAQGH